MKKKYLIIICFIIAVLSTFVGGAQWIIINNTAVDRPSAGAASVNIAKIQHWEVDSALSITTDPADTSDGTKYENATATTTKSSEFDSEDDCHIAARSYLDALGVTNYTNGGEGPYYGTDGQKSNESVDGAKTTWTQTWKQCTFSYGSSGVWIFKKYYYKITVKEITVTYTSERRQTYTQMTDASGEVLEESYKGENLLKPSFSMTGYDFVDFWDVSPTSTSTKSSYDFSKPIQGTVTIYAIWAKKSTSSTESNQTLTEFISDTTGSAVVYESSANTSSEYFNLAFDRTYSEATKTANIGQSSTETILQSGAVLNLCANINGTWKTNQEAENGTDIVDTAASSTPADVHVYLKNNTKNYTYVLQGDVIINGTLVIGGHTGSPKGSGADAKQGLIIGNYVELDLNGYTLTVNGVLHSFGNIVDSKGTGKIVVNAGGELRSPVVLDTLNGGNDLLWRFSKGICPFENYSLPYLNCKVDFVSTSATSSGKLVAFTKLNLGSFGFKNLYLPLLGPDASFFFNVCSAGKVTYDYYIIDALKDDEGYVAKNCYNRKDRFVFNGVTVKTGYASIEVKASIDIKLTVVEAKTNLQTDKFNFPMSGTIDASFINSAKFVLNQGIRINAGCSLTIDNTSELVLGYYTGSGTDKDEGSTPASKTYEKVNAGMWGLPALTKYLSGRIVTATLSPNQMNVAHAPNNGMFNTERNSALWKYYSAGVVNVYGTLRLKAGNASGAPYVLSGNINVNKIAYGDGAGKVMTADVIAQVPSEIKLETYGIEVQGYICNWLDSSKFSESQYTSINYFWVAPLISGGVAYINNVDGTCITGTFDATTGIFTALNEDEYVLYDKDNKLLEDDASSKINYVVTPIKCDVEWGGKFLNINEKTYIYFGGYIMPIIETITENFSSTNSVTAKPKKFAVNHFGSYKDYANGTFTFTYDGSKWKVTA